MTEMPALIRTPLVWIASALLLAVAVIACGPEAATPTATPTASPNPRTTAAADPAPESEVDRTGRRQQQRRPGLQQRRDAAPSYRNRQGGRR